MFWNFLGQAVLYLKCAVRRLESGRWNDSVSYAGCSGPGLGGCVSFGDMTGSCEYHRLWSLVFEILGLDLG